MDNNMPLNIMLELAKTEFKQAFNKVLNETKLPAYLVEGIVLDILADIRNRKNFELMAEYKAAFDNKTAEEEKKKG